jgi:Ca2+-binding EF-hand superfamily protein
VTSTYPYPHPTYSSQVDEDGSGQIDFDEFLQVVAMYMPDDQDNEKEILSAYIAMGGDPDKGGFIEADRLRKVVKEFGLTIDLEALLAHYDTDYSGKIEFDEFKAMMGTDEVN